MTTLEKIKKTVQTANTESVILSDTIVEAVMPKVIEAIDKQFKDIGYDGITYNRPASEYPDFLYSVIYHTVIRQVILDYLEANHPMAWFKPMFFSQEQYKQFQTKIENEKI